MIIKALTKFNSEIVNHRLSKHTTFRTKYEYHELYVKYSKKQLHIKRFYLKIFNSDVYNVNILAFSQKTRYTIQRHFLVL